MERVLELVNIAANKNTVPGDKSAVIPGGIRMGTPAMTSRGFEEKDWLWVADRIDEVVKITKDLNQRLVGEGGKKANAKLKDFKELLGDGKQVDEIQELAKATVEYTKNFPNIGF